MSRLARVDSSRSTPLRARAELETDGRAWRLTLSTELDGVAGERTLTAKSCRALVNAATLTLALILNPDVETPEPEPAPESPSHPLEWGAALSARAGAAQGQLDGLGPSFALGAGLLLEAASVWAYAGFAPPKDTRVNGSSGPGGRLWSGSAAVFGCWDFTRRTPLGPCAGAELTRVQGQGIAVRNPETAAVYWASGLFGLRAGVRLGDSVTLRLEGFALIPAQRPSLFLEDIGRVVRPDPLGGKVHAGADFELR